MNSYSHSNTIRKALTIVVWLVLISFGQMAFSEYSPPIGIPAPSFGIDEVAPPLPDGWNSNVSGFYYVKSGGSNSGNGYPGSPRSTIPDPIDAGSVVVIEGTYTTKHENNPITSNGTASEPVFIKGINDQNHAVLTEKIVLDGSYYIVEYIDGLWSNASYNGKIALKGDHGSVRFGDFQGDVNQCVGGVHSYGGTQLVIYKNKIHHSGDVNATYDQDCHGTVVPSGTTYLWILENEYSYNSGDGIQINAGNAGNDAIHHIYVGGNKSHHNKQTGMWIKQARDIIFSQNEIYDHVPSDSSGGAGTGFQYGPDYVWFLFNRIHDNEGGIMLASDSGGTGTEHFIIGNEIYNIRKSGSFDVGSPWEAAAIGVWGSTNTYIVGNTIWNSSAGILSPRARGKIDIINNIIGAPSVSGANHILFELNLIDTSTVDYNVFVNPVALRMGSSTQIDLSGLQSIHDQGFNSYAVNNMDFVTTSDGQFVPSESSVAANSGYNSPDVYDIFFQRYGIDIKKDITGAPRIMDGNAEIGAYEITGERSITVAPPSPPTLSVE